MVELTLLEELEKEKPERKRKGDVQRSMFNLSGTQTYRFVAAETSKIPNGLLLQVQSVKVQLLCRGQTI